jgi:hypothetical protein
MKKVFAFIIIVSSCMDIAAQNVGIGTTTPIARLHVADSNVLFTGPVSIPGSTPYFPPASGAGSRMMWYPQKAAFRVGAVSGMQWDKDSIGHYSFSSGYSTKANGPYSTGMGYYTNAAELASTSMGYGTIANGVGSTSMGFNTNASGHYSTSMGYGTTASGVGSTSMGLFTKAKSANSLAIGIYNDSSNTNRLFEIGNGTDDNLRANAMTVLNNGNTGIGVAEPIARLHVADSSVLFTGPVTVPGSTTYFPPASGAGSRMMWYPQKAAFRVGAVDDTQWDKDSIGLYSFSSGYNTKSIGLLSTSMGNAATASGSYSMSIGNGTTASGHNSTSMGGNTHASGQNSTSMGESTTASGNFSTSMGINTFASGNSSTSMGNNTFASGNYSTSMGQQTNASGNSSTSMGTSTFASGNSSTSMGINTFASGPYSTSMGSGTIASGTYSTSMGYGTRAKSYNSLAIGVFNDSSNTNRLFEIGNGTADNARSNAFTVLTNGKVGIGTTNPTSTLSFANTIGKKISFYGGVTGDYGMSVEGGQLRIFSDGPTSKVSIGTDDYINGNTENAKAERIGVFSFEVLGSLWVNGTTYASDERFKQNISPISSPLQKLMQINGVEYEMKTTAFANRHFQPGRQMGLIAQNVEKIVPEAVNEKDGYKGVDYARLVPLLIESIKEQNKKMEDQQKQIDEQRKMIEQLLKK